MKGNNKFKYYRRGQVVQVKFEPQTGYEIKGIHYAIVLTKRDQPFIGTLTVIPLTSKKGNHLTPIGSCISDSLIDELNKESDYYNGLFNKISDRIEEIQRKPELIKTLTDNEFKQMRDDLNAYKSNYKYFESLILKYKNIKQASYANINQITTIDKSKILNPLNKLDPLPKLKVPNEILDMIDKKIIELFTNI